MMKASFMQRFFAYLIDMIVIAVVSVFVGLLIPNYKNNDSLELNQELNTMEEKLIEVMQSGDKSSYKKVMQDVVDIEFKIAKSSVLSETVSFVILFGYFVILQFILKGRTVGKMAMGIKVIDKKKNEPSFWIMLYRTFIIEGIITSFIALVSILLLNKNSYVMFNMSLNSVVSIFVIVSALMILYRKDRRGLHDMMAGTSVVKIDK